MVQWLGLYALTEEDLGSVPGLGTKIPSATWYSLLPPPRKKKKRKETPNQKTFHSANEEMKLKIK